MKWNPGWGWLTPAIVTAGLALGAVGSAQAHGPSRQKVVESISIDAPASVVWAKIKNFDSLKDWHPAVESSTATNGNTVGSVRALKLKGGGDVSESLESFDDAGMKYGYRMADGGAIPVSNYTSHITVKADGDTKSTVEWAGAFYRAYPNNDPPPDKNDDAAIAAVTGVYKTGLANLKKLAEAK